MTFERWFEKEYGSKPDLENDSYSQVAKAAWDAGYQAGGSAEVEWQDYLDRLDD